MQDVGTWPHFIQGRLLAPMVDGKSRAAVVQAWGPTGFVSLDEVSVVDVTNPRCFSGPEGAQVRASLDAAGGVYVVTRIDC